MKANEKKLVDALIGMGDKKRIRRITTNLLNTEDISQDVADAVFAKLDAPDTKDGGNYVRARTVMPPTVDDKTRDRIRERDRLERERMESNRYRQSDPCGGSRVSRSC